MKLHLLCLLVFALAFSRVHGQTAGDDAANPDTPPAGATLITSDELRMDQMPNTPADPQGHTSIFTGNVVVTGTNFRMTCEEMTVYFDTASKIDHIIAKGNVIIVQPGRITHCGQAIYYHAEDKFVLTIQPHILDNRNEIWAPEITIFRTQQSLITKGPTRTIIRQGIGSPTTPAPTGEK